MTTDEAERKTVEQVAALLNLLTLERRIAVRESLTNVLLDVWPNARIALLQTARDDQRETARAAFDRLIRGVLSHRWSVDTQATEIWLASSVEHVLRGEDEELQTAHTDAADIEAVQRRDME